MDRGKQKDIWEIEHATFELEKKFGRRFIEALREGNHESLQEFFRAGASAEILDPNQRVTLNHGLLRQVNADRDFAAVVPADVSQLVSQLSASFGEFAEIENVAFRVLDLRADNEAPQSGSWRAICYLAGVGKDASGGFIEFVSEHRLRLHFSDDDAVAIGRIIDHWSVQSEVFRYCRDPLFQEVTTVVGLDRADIRDNWDCAIDQVRQYYSHMAVEDFDRDGFLDLAVASANGRWQLLKSLAGKEFKEVTGEVGLPLWADEEPRSKRTCHRRPA